MSSTNQLTLEILSFWWDAGFKSWFVKDEEFDKKITHNFLDAYEQAANGDFDEWVDSPHSALALIILLDQFPRNMFRNSPRAFATDEKALSVAKTALDRNYFLAYPSDIRSFYFLPFEHAEDMDSQDLSVDCFRKYGNSEGYMYALIHMDIIRRFGRFPHRNEILGRESTEAELKYLQEKGFAG